MTFNQEGLRFLRAKRTEQPSDLTPDESHELIELTKAELRERFAEVRNRVASGMPVVVFRQSSMSVVQAGNGHVRKGVLSKPTVGKAFDRLPSLLCFYQIKKLGSPLDCI